MHVLRFQSENARMMMAGGDSYEEFVNKSQFMSKFSSSFNFQSKLLICQSNAMQFGTSWPLHTVATLVGKEIAKFKLARKEFEQNKSQIPSLKTLFRLNLCMSLCVNCFEAGNHEGKKTLTSIKFINFRTRLQQILFELRRKVGAMLENWTILVF